MSYFTWNQKKWTVLHWLILFFLGNLCLYWIIGLGYLSQLSWYFIDFAMIESTGVTRIYSAGNYQIENYRGEIAHGGRINVAAMNSAFRDFTHFN